MAQVAEILWQPPILLVLLGRLKLLLLCNKAPTNPHGDFPADEEKRRTRYQSEDCQKKRQPPVIVKFPMPV